VTDVLRVVAVNGSPHREGNTATLMGWVLEGCRSAGAEVTWIHLVDSDLRFCRGCSACLRLGTCPQRDDLAAILDRLLSARAIVAGSPVYLGSPSAQMKLLLDRLSLLQCYAGTFDRHWSVGVATSSQGPNLGVARRLASFFGHPVGALGARTCTAREGCQPLASHHPRRLPERARALGRRLVADARAGRRAIRPLDPAWREAALLSPLRRLLFVRPLIVLHPEPYAAVLRIWREKGWL